MEDPHFSGPHTVRLTSFGPNDAGFGVVVETGARCFVSKHFVDHFDLCEDDEVRVMLQENPDPNRAVHTPYAVKYVYPTQPPLPLRSENDAAT